MQKIHSGAPLRAGREITSIVREKGAGVNTGFGGGSPPVRRNAPDFGGKSGAHSPWGSAAGGEDAQDVLCRGRAARDALFGVVAAGADSKAVEGNPPPALADGYG